MSIQNIVGGQGIQISQSDNLGQTIIDIESCYLIEQLANLVKHNSDAQKIIKNIIKESLREIIKEEAADPNGALGVE